MAHVQGHAHTWRHSATLPNITPPLQAAEVTSGHSGRPCQGRRTAFPRLPSRGVPPSPFRRVHPWQDRQAPAWAGQGGRDAEHDASSRSISHIIVANSAGRWAAAPPQRRGALSRKAQMTDLAELVLRELTRRALWERRLCHIFLRPSFFPSPCTQSPQPRAFQRKRKKVDAAHG